MSASPYSHLRGRDLAFLAAVKTHLDAVAHLSATRAVEALAALDAAEEQLRALRRRLVRYEALDRRGSTAPTRSGRAGARALHVCRRGLDRDLSALSLLQWWLRTRKACRRALVSLEAARSRCRAATELIEESRKLLDSARRHPARESGSVSSSS